MASSAAAAAPAAVPEFSIGDAVTFNNEEKKPGVKFGLGLVCKINNDTCDVLIIHEKEDKLTKGDKYEVNKTDMTKFDHLTFSDEYKSQFPAECSKITLKQDFPFSSVRTRTESYGSRFHGGRRTRNRRSKSRSNSRSTRQRSKSSRSTRGRR